MTPDTKAAFDAGRALFNEGRFLEAHETWEAAWRRDQGPDRVMLQSLLMVTGACVKASRGEPRGTVKLLESALELLPARHDAFDAEALRASCRALLEQARAWHAGGPAVVVALEL